MAELQAEIQGVNEEDAKTRGLCKVKRDQIRFMEEKLAAMRAQLQAKMEGIERWRIQMKAKFRVGDETLDQILGKEVLVSDQDSLETISRKISIKIEHPGDKKEFERTFAVYAEKLKAREQQIQKLVAKAQNMRSHLSELSESHDKDDQRLTELEQEGLKLRNEYSEVAMREQTLEHQRDDRQAQLELGIRKQGEDDFNEFLKKNEQVFKGVKKTYGTKVAEKIKQEHKREINELAMTQQLERRNAIRAVHSTIQRLSLVIESTEACDKLVPQINEVARDCDRGNRQEQRVRRRRRR